MKTQFLANMSHEIRTPLNAMFAFNDAIIQNPGDMEKVKEYAFNIHEAGENLKDIINFITDIDPNLPEVLIGDEPHLRQVLTNIFQVITNNRKRKTSRICGYNHAVNENGQNIYKG